MTGWKGTGAGGTARGRAQGAGGPAAAGTGTHEARDAGHAAPQVEAPGSPRAAGPELGVDAGEEGLVPPHGGRLCRRLVDDPALAAERRAAAQAAGLPRLLLSPRERSDLELLATGALSPLEGFMTAEDYHGCVDAMRLASGLPWSLPVVLSVPPDQVEAVRRAPAVLLVDEGGRPCGLMEVRDVFRRDRQREAVLVFGTTDVAHPGVARLAGESDWCAGGPVVVFERQPTWAREWVLEPAETRRLFARRGWRLVAGFQTRNPLHRAHEYLQKCALEMVDGLLLHPLVGETKADDLPRHVVLESYRVAVRAYYPQERVVLAAFPAAMRYAGPREALFHALIRKNYGCSHFIVGRDHAGVGSYYDPYAAHRIFDRFAPEELGVIPLRFEHAFYCRRCGAMATVKTCPHPPADRLHLSGTRVRAMLRAGELPPPEFTRPEVAELLRDALAAQGA
ncbi:sulfate adenylyltransferase [Thermaerobacter subterraneus]|uniref:Sulfate adenylyltransferase n=1 Tax=Thermaerobacter subterraneus DSM 13965 TaxID=867903 RepID=K6QDN1_9FIRM|nr:sulfate adenylyltransferase [Thermaerobacter subterraneus]EKP94821.1 sulfate adenylyltransferase [Thermaerobacter subterraneus DSM 13965]